MEWLQGIGVSEKTKDRVAWRRDFISIEKKYPLNQREHDLVRWLTDPITVPGERETVIDTPDPEKTER